MQEIFQKIPKASLEYVKGLINCENILFKLKKNRETRHGDFSVKKDFSVEITINSDMNPFRFLITLLHEISHFFIYKDFGFNTKPHGYQWKSKFKELLIPVINNKVFPDDSVAINSPICYKYLIMSQSTIVYLNNYESYSFLFY